TFVDLLGDEPAIVEVAQDGQALGEALGVGHAFADIAAGSSICTGLDGPPAHLNESRRGSPIRLPQAIGDRTVKSWSHAQESAGAKRHSENIHSSCRCSSGIPSSFLQPGLLFQRAAQPRRLGSVAISVTG